MPFDYDPDFLSRLLKRPCGINHILEIIRSSFRGIIVKNEYLAFYLITLEIEPHLYRGIPRMNGLARF